MYLYAVHHHEFDFIDVVGFDREWEHDEWEHDEWDYDDDYDDEWEHEWEHTVATRCCRWGCVCGTACFFFYI